MYNLAGWQSAHHPSSQFTQNPSKAKSQHSSRSQWPPNLGNGRWVKLWIQTLPIGKVATVEAVTSPPHKSEASPWPVNTSNQASMEEAEASLEGLPANISPISATCSSGSASPSVDPIELQTNANMATDHMLCMKRSTDLKRQWVIWELGLLLHQSEVDEAMSVKKAKVIHSWEVLDAKVGCTRSVLEAKCNYWAAVQEAKMIRGNLLQKSEIAYSKAIARPWPWDHPSLWHSIGNIWGLHRN